MIDARTMMRLSRLNEELNVTNGVDLFKRHAFLGFSEQAILRALGWYRKGLYTEDPFDKFLAFWNSIEIVAGKYHPPIPEGRPTGSKSQIWQCFKAIWGECEGWPTISGDTDWIDDNYEIRFGRLHMEPYLSCFMKWRSSSTN